MKVIKLAGAALNQIPMDWENNFNNISKAINDARKTAVDILCLPELCITGYGCEDMFLSDWLYSHALEMLQMIVPLCENIVVCAGLPFKFNGKNYNVICLIENRQIKGIVPKQFLANDGVHYEPRWFTPWPPGVIKQINIAGQPHAIGDTVFEVNGIKIGFEICEDAWRGAYRPGWRLKQNHVDLILNPSASHFAFGKAQSREELVKSSSEKFNCTYIYANLLGNEAGRMIYDGDIIIAQKGKLLAKNIRLSFHGINILTTEINFDDPEQSTASPVGVSEDKETEFTNASSLGLFDYLRKSGLNGFVISLSGGADSSTCATLVATMIRKAYDELGWETMLSKLGYDHENPPVKDNGLSKEERIKQFTGLLLITAYQASENSSGETLEAAQYLADSIGATFHHWHIDEEVNSFTCKIQKAINRELNWVKDDITLQNIQARVRSPIIWMLANIHNALLITTSNRSEGDAGYATMDGDTSGSIAPIAGVDKHFVAHWLKWAEKNLNFPGLKYVNILNPTAELKPAEAHQSDESDLMPYHIMVRIERMAIKEKRSPLTVFQELNKEKIIDKEHLKNHVTKFYKLWARNQWKRERIAPSFHLDDFNIDPRTWCRFPILSGNFKEELEALRKA